LEEHLSTGCRKSITDDLELNNDLHGLYACIAQLDSKL